MGIEDNISNGATDKSPRVEEGGEMASEALKTATVDAMTEMWMASTTYNNFHSEDNRQRFVGALGAYKTVFKQALASGFTEKELSDLAHQKMNDMVQEARRELDQLKKDTHGFQKGLTTPEHRRREGELERIANARR